MKYVVILIVVVIIIVALAAVLIPKTSSATATISFDAPVDQVWAVYTDPAGQKDWRDDIKDVTVSDDGQSWTETLSGSGLVIHFEVVESTPPTRFKLKSRSPGNFEGRYTATFTETEAGTVGTFTEEATSLGVIPKLMRFVFFNPQAFIEQYAEGVKQELARRAGN